MPGQKQMDVVMSIMGRVDKLLPKGIQDIAAKVGALERELAKKNSEFDRAAKKEVSAVNRLKSLNDAYFKNKNEIQRLIDVKKSVGALSTEEEAKLRALVKENKKYDTQITKVSKSIKEYQNNTHGLADEQNKLQKELHETAKAAKRMEAQNAIKERTKNALKGGQNAILSGAAYLGRKALMAGALAGAAGVYTAKQGTTEYLTFQQQMKKVQAVSLATEKDYIRLEEAALKAGASTQFTSTQAAQALEELSRAGKSVDDQIELLPKLLDLATASGADMQQSTKILLGTMAAFQVPVKDAEKAMDKLVYVSATRKVDIEGLGEAIKYVGTKANLMGISLDETVAVIGMLGETNLEGGQAGRNLAAGLVDASQKAKKFGINIKDQKGNFIGFVKLLEQVEKKTAKMGKVDQANFLYNIFGAQGSKTVGAMMVSEYGGFKGSQAIKAYEATMADHAQGATQKTANIMREGAAGAITALKSAWNNFQIIVGKMIFSDAVVDKVKALSNYIGKLVLVLNGNWEDAVNDKVVGFWYKIRIKIINFIKDLKKIFAPAAETIRSWFPKETPGLGFFKLIGDGVLKLANAFAFAIRTIDPIIKIIQKIGPDTVAVGLSVVMAGAKVVSTISNIKEAIIKAGGVFKAIGAASNVFNPWVILITVIATAAYFIWKNWEPIKAWFIAFWEKIKAIANSVKERIVTICDKIKLFAASIIEAVSNVQEFWQKWKDEYPFLQHVENGIRLIGAPIFALIDAAKEFWTHWKEGDGIVGSLLAAFGTFFDSLWNTFKTWVGDILNEIAKIPAKAIESAKNFFVGKAGKDPVVDPNLTFAGTIYGTHAKGLANVPFDNYLSYLHAGERVLTAAENRSFTSLFGSQIGAINKRGGILDRVSTTASNYNTSNTYKNGDNSESFSFSIGNITIGGNADAGIASQIGEEIAKRVRIELKKRDDAKHDRERRKL
ncbi:MAG: phage tail tape measure protein [Fusobacteriaceae bacterium]|jgi:TP901 family phage tail tape measure protein|nr:phage tail tape measure protein [Fusobacteriaceae bacterium]